MKSLLVLTVLFALNTQASTKAITCTFESLHPSATVTMAVDNLENPSEMQSAWPYLDYDGEESAATFSGEEELEWLYYLVAGGDSWLSSDESGNFVFGLDSDGCDVGTLKLFKNNGFKFGYVKVEHRCSGAGYPDSYSKAKCTVSDL